jgi:hypothetical protein
MITEFSSRLSCDGNAFAAKLALASFDLTTGEHTIAIYATDNTATISQDGREFTLSPVNSWTRHPSPTPVLGRQRSGLRSALPIERPSEAQTIGARGSVTAAAILHRGIWRLPHEKARAAPPGESNRMQAEPRGKTARAVARNTNCT